MLKREQLDGYVGVIDVVSKKEKQHVFMMQGYDSDILASITQLIDYYVKKTHLPLYKVLGIIDDAIRNAPRSNPKADIDDLLNELKK